MSTLQNIYQITDEDIISLLYSPEGKLYSAKCAEKCLKKLEIFSNYNITDLADFIINNFEKANHKQLVIGI